MRYLGPCATADDESALLVITYSRCEFLVRFHATTKNPLIEHPDKERFPDPLVTIREETYSPMTLDRASGSLGISHPPIDADDATAI